MKLDEFIQTAISEICSGIEKSRNKNKNFGVALSILNTRGTMNNSTIQRSQMNIEFDIAFKIVDTVKSELNSEINTGGFLEVIGAKIGVDTKIDDEKQSESVHRIKFSVPIIPFPTTE